MMHVTEWDKWNGSDKSEFRTKDLHLREPCVIGKSLSDTTRYATTNEIITGYKIYISAHQNDQTIQNQINIIKVTYFH